MCIDGFVGECGECVGKFPYGRFMLSMLWIMVFSKKFFLSTDDDL